MSRAGNWSRRLLAPCLWAALVGDGLAQIEPSRAEAELARVQRQRDQSRAEAERLLELRLRHDLGLPTEETERTFRSPEPVSTEAMERMGQELRDADAETAVLAERLEKLRGVAELKKTEAEARARREAEERAFITVPVAGSGPVRSEPVAATAGSSEPPRDAARPEVPEPLLEVGAIDPLRTTIQGSTDHQRVANALFKAGQALMTRAASARHQGHLEIARQLDERGKDRLQRALDELKPLLESKEPPYEALFCRGRCLELLFRHSERHEKLSLTTSTRDYQRREQEVREPFLAITVRDKRATGQRGEVEVLGPWGLAAQSAMQHFAWTNQHAGYDAMTAIKALTWPGEKDQ